MNAPVMGITGTTDKTIRLEPLDDARHCRRPDLLRRSELTERARPAEDQHGKSRELSRRNAGRGVLPAYVSESVDGGRVEAVGCVY
jgi:hypothetical protein